VAEALEVEKAATVRKRISNFEDAARNDTFQALEVLVLDLNRANSPGE
jgi:hypothetical protein